MITVKFLIDYSKILPSDILSKIDVALIGKGFSTSNDLDGDKFEIIIMPYGSQTFDIQTCQEILNLVNPYLFKN